MQGCSTLTVHALKPINHTLRTFAYVAVLEIHPAVVVHAVVDSRS